MKNSDDGFALFSPCMFGKGSGYDDVSHTPKGPESFSWGNDNTGKSHSKTKNMTPWSPPLALTNESSLHSSKVEPCSWKCSGFHERESETDDVYTNCCCENDPEESEESGVPCWNSGFLLDDGNAKVRDVQGSSPWSECLPVTRNGFANNNSSSRGPRSRESSQMKKTRVSTSTYKHIPHRNKPPQLVARRNARERRRVQAVNCAFNRLRKVVPMESNR